MNMERKSFWAVYWTALPAILSSTLEQRRAATRERVIYLDLNRKGQNMTTQWTGDTDSVYRVYISPTTKRVEVVFLGIDSVDSEGEGIYDDVSLLPRWMQDRLAVLLMIKVDPPQTKVEGVGMRVDNDVFWIIKG